MKPIVIAPCILPADLRRLSEEVRAARQAGADWIHGADVIVAGTSIFGSDDYTAAIAGTRESTIRVKGYAR